MHIPLAHGLLVHGTLKYHLHRPKQICGEEFPPPRKWLTITNSANGPTVLLVTVSKVGYNFLAGVVGMSLCRGKELPVVASRSGVENGAEETTASC